LAGWQQDIHQSQWRAAISVRQGTGCQLAKRSADPVLVAAAEMDM
jgi:hypothetical protein